MKQDHVKNKISIVEPEITNDINKKIDTNIYQYLSMKNVNSIMREYLIERQNQNHESLEQEINVLKMDLLNTKFQLQLLQKDKELLLKVANEKITNLEQKIKSLENKQSITKEIF
ncbi:hypothetical protein [Spiroplasma sp. AdecLV25b]|uniref:hypothetical protein n=1 Tax=Spiroplasma sp. AdecLV25b TaxID=3027162 RepID=UPI0027E1FF0A|nr:hypothetical protein [Spiroplasma sp. AdecLV25b]